MRSTSTDPAPDVRRFLFAFVSQLVLTAAAVLASRLNVGTIAVMSLAAVNASIVAVTLMGVRRDGRLISLLAAATLVFLVGLLIWPAWDVYERMRPF